ncbi:uncharacterized protein LOC142499986 [Ascaphus truei]|uniref:uncharacterized protein LOC142499986 n=1 Tax=Ascaphus truei TaxID=8439 RepID=UPI003F59D345
MADEFVTSRALIHKKGTTPDAATPARAARSTAQWKAKTASDGSAPKPAEFKHEWRSKRKGFAPEDFAIPMHLGTTVPGVSQKTRQASDSGSLRNRSSSTSSREADRATSALLDYKEKRQKTEERREEEKDRRTCQKSIALRIKRFLLQSESVAEDIKEDEEDGEEDKDCLHPGRGVATAEVVDNETDSDLSTQNLDELESEEEFVEETQENQSLEETVEHEDAEALRELDVPNPDDSTPQLFLEGYNPDQDIPHPEIEDEEDHEPLQAGQGDNRCSAEYASLKSSLELFFQHQQSVADNQQKTNQTICDELINMRGIFTQLDTLKAISNSLTIIEQCMAKPQPMPQQNPLLQALAQALGLAQPIPYPQPNPLLEALAQALGLATPQPMPQQQAYPQPEVLGLAMPKPMPQQQAYP